MTNHHSLAPRVASLFMVCMIRRSDNHVVPTLEIPFDSTFMAAMFSCKRLLKIPSPIRLHLSSLIHLLPGLRHTEAKTDASEALRGYHKILKIYLNTRGPPTPKASSKKADTSINEGPDGTLAKLSLSHLQDVCEDLSSEILQRQTKSDARKDWLRAQTLTLPSPTPATPVSRTSSSRRRKAMEAAAMTNAQRRQKLRSSLHLISEVHLRRMAATVLFEIERRAPELVQREEMKDLRRMSREVESERRFGRQRAEKQQEFLEVMWHKNLDEFLGIGTSVPTNL
jgi:hypothetical protein